MDSIVWNFQNNEIFRNFEKVNPEIFTISKILDFFSIFVISGASSFSSYIVCMGYVNFYNDEIFRNFENFKPRNFQNFKKFSFFFQYSRSVERALSAHI